MEQHALSRLTELLKDDSESKSEVNLLSAELMYLVQMAVDKTGNKKLSNAVAIGSVAYTVATVAKGFYKVYKKSKAPQYFTIKITEADQVFETVENWVMDALPEECQRSVFAHSTTIRGNDTPRRVRRRRFSGLPQSDSVPETEDGKRDRVAISYSFDGTIVQNLTIAGHEVEVYTVVPEKAASTSEGGRRSAWDSRAINIVCKSIEARNAVLDEIENQSQHLVDSQPRMYVSTRWGDWRRGSEIQPRSKSSVVLKEGQMNRILTHLNTFLDNKEAYRLADIPFRTGIMLYG